MIYKPTNYPTMPWGKHEGKRLDEIPRGYLQWVIKNLDLSPILEEQIACVLENRQLPESLDAMLNRLMVKKENELFRIKDIDG